jgi:hypothetical protein
MVNSGLVERLGKGEEEGEAVDTPSVSVNYPRQAPRRCQPERNM